MQYYPGRPLPRRGAQRRLHRESSIEETGNRSMVRSLARRERLADSVDERALRILFGAFAVEAAGAVSVVPALSAFLGRNHADAGPLHPDGSIATAVNAGNW